MHVCTYVPVQSMYLCISNASITYEYTERGDESFALQLINYIIHKLSQLLLHILDYNSDFWEVWRTESRKYCLAFLVVSSLYMLLLNKVFLWEEGHTPHILICGAGFSPFSLFVHQCLWVSIYLHCYKKCLDFKHIWEEGSLRELQWLSLIYLGREIWPVADGGWKEAGAIFLHKRSNTRALSKWFGNSVISRALQVLCISLSGFLCAPEVAIGFPLPFSICMVGWLSGWGCG